MSKPCIVLLGEPMLELSHPPGHEAKLSHGGDILNTSIYLARLGLQPHLITALGQDPYSDGMLKEWERECVQTSHILRDPKKLPGLYSIQTDHRGERSFYYWRENSAAQNFFNLEGAEASLEFAKQADWLFLSGITLSIFNEDERAILAVIAKTVRENGGQVVFDPNYRPAGWPNHSVAGQAIKDFARHATLILATIDDENLLYGQMSGENHFNRWRDLGVETVILKCGPRGAIIYDRKEPAVTVPVEVCEHPVDTTGAGDSFNAGYIAKKVKGSSNKEAAESGNKLASQVIRHSGAIIPPSVMPDF